jgi:hypothetical protein
MANKDIDINKLLDELIFKVTNNAFDQELPVLGDFILEESNVDVYYPFMPAKKPYLSDDSVIILENDGQFYFELEIAENVRIRYFLNFDPKIPEGTFIYDYFGSGELYLNPRKGTSISAGSLNWKKLIKTMFFDPSVDSPLRHMPDEEGISFFHSFDGMISSRYCQQSETYGWLFDKIETFFYTENCEDNRSIDSASPLNGQQKFLPICKNYSYHDVDVAISSSEYKFANHIPGVATCSHYGENEQVVSAKFCIFETSRQSNCPFYVPLVNRLQEVEVTPNNTNDKITIVLQHFVSMNRYNVFTIMNQTDNTIINQMAVPEEVSYDDAITQAVSLLQEYTSCYNDHTKENRDIDDSSSQSVKEKNPFIQSLLV